MIHSEDGVTPLLSPALRYLPSHSSSYRTIPSVPLPSDTVTVTIFALSPIHDATKPDVEQLACHVLYGDVQ